MSLGSWFVAGYEGFDDEKDYQKFLQQRDDDPNGSDGDDGAEWSDDPYQQMLLCRMGVDNRHNGGAGGGGAGGRRGGGGGVYYGLPDEEEDDDSSSSFDEDDFDDEDGFDNDHDCGYYDEDESNADGLSAQPHKSRHFFNSSNNFEAEREKQIASQTACDEPHDGNNSSNQVLLMTPQQKRAMRESRRSMKARLKAMQSASAEKANAAMMLSALEEEGGNILSSGGGKRGEEDGDDDDNAILALQKKLQQQKRRMSGSKHGRSGVSSSASQLSTRKDNLTNLASRTSVLKPFAVPASLIGSSTAHSNNNSRSIGNALLTRPLQPLIGHAVVPLSPSVTRRLLLGRDDVDDHTSNGRGTLLVSFGGVNLNKVLGATVPSATSSSVPAAALAPSALSGGTATAPPLLGPGSAFVESRHATLQRFDPSAHDGKTSRSHDDEGKNNSLLGAAAISTSDSTRFLEDVPSTTSTSASGALPTGRFGHCLVSLDLSLSSPSSSTSLPSSYQHRMLLIGGCCDTNLNTVRSAIHGATTTSSASNPNHTVPTAENPSVHLAKSVVPKAVVLDPWLITLSRNAAPITAEAPCGIGLQQASQQKTHNNAKKKESVADFCKRAARKSLVESYLNDDGGNVGGNVSGNVAAAAVGGTDRYGNDITNAAASGGDSQDSTTSSAASSSSSSSSVYLMDAESGRVLQRHNLSTICSSLPAPSSSRVAGGAPAAGARPSAAEAPQPSSPPTPPTPVNMDYRMVHSIVGDAPTPRCFATCVQIPSHWWGDDVSWSSDRGRGEKEEPQHSPRQQHQTTFTLLLFGGTYDGKHPIGWRSSNINGSGNVGSFRARRSLTTNSQSNTSGNVFDHILPDDLAVMSEQETDVESDVEGGGAVGNRSSHAFGGRRAQQIRETYEQLLVSAVQNATATETAPLPASSTSDPVVPPQASPQRTATTASNAETQPQQRPQRILRDRASAADELVLMHIDISEKALICEAHSKMGMTVDAVGDTSPTTTTSIRQSSAVTSSSFTGASPTTSSTSFPAPRFGHSAVVLHSTRKMCVFGGVGGFYEPKNSRRSASSSSLTMRKAAAGGGASSSLSSSSSSSVCASQQPILLSDCWFLDLMTLRWQEVSLWHNSPSPQRGIISSSFSRSSALSMPSRAFHGTLSIGSDGGSRQSSAVVNDCDEHLLILGGQLGVPSSKSSSDKQKQSVNNGSGSGDDGDVSALSAVCVRVASGGWRPLALQFPSPSSSTSSSPPPSSSSPTAPQRHDSSFASGRREALRNALSLPQQQRRKEEADMNDNCTPQLTFAKRTAMMRLATKRENEALLVLDKLSLLMERRRMRPIVDDEGLPFQQQVLTRRKRVQNALANEDRRSNVGPNAKTNKPAVIAYASATTTDDFALTAHRSERKRIRFEFEVDERNIGANATHEGVGVNPRRQEEEDDTNDGYIRPESDADENDEKDSNDNASVSIVNAIKGEGLCKENEDNDDDAFDFEIPDIPEDATGGVNPATVSATADWDVLDEDQTDNIAKNGEGEVNKKMEDSEPLNLRFPQNAQKGSHAPGVSVTKNASRPSSHRDGVLACRAVAALHGAYLQAVAVPASSSRNNTVVTLIMGGDASYDLSAAVLMRIPALSSAPSCLSLPSSATRNDVSSASSSMLLKPSLKALLFQLLIKDSRWTDGFIQDAAGRRPQQQQQQEEGVSSFMFQRPTSTLPTYATNLPFALNNSNTSHATHRIAALSSSPQQQQRQQRHGADVDYWVPSDHTIATDRDPTHQARYAAASRALGYRPRKRAGEAFS